MLHTYDRRAKVRLCVSVEGTMRMAPLVMPGWPNGYNMLITILVDYGLTESCIWLSTLYSWQDEGNITCRNVSHRSEGVVGGGKVPTRLLAPTRPLDLDR